MPVAMEKPSATNISLEQFLLLGKSAKGAAAVELVKQVTEAHGIYVFGELLDLPNIKDLAAGQYVSYFRLLNLFAYGTYSEYRENKSMLPPLSSLQLEKLRHLTIASLAIKNKRLPYTVLLKELDISNLRELEDLIIEVIYADIIRGKLDQKHQQLEIDYAIGRDIRPDNVKEIISVLSDWCVGCEAVLQNLEQQVAKANERKENEAKTCAKIEQEVSNIKKTLKTAHHQEMDEQMVVDSREMHYSMMDKGGKKQQKVKSNVRTGSGKK